MTSSLIYSFAAAMFMVPVPLTLWLGKPPGKAFFWFNTLSAFLWSFAASWQYMSGEWSSALSADLWVTISATLFLFILVSLADRRCRPLQLLLMPYLFLLTVLALLAAHAEGPSLQASAPNAWIDVHILVSVTMLGLLTLAAAAALAALIQARALKTKRPNALSRRLPAMTDSEQLYERLLLLSEAVLAVGVASGMATQFAESGRLLVFDHKTLFSLLAFVLIAGLIGGRRWGGVRGKMAVRLLLVAYSFVLLGYFGVKFVRQVLLA